MYITIGLLQGIRKRSATQATSHRKGKVLQPPSGGEDQESWRSMCTDGINFVITQLNCCWFTIITIVL